MTIDEFQVQDGYECPTCGKVLNTSLGLKQHHTKVHGESLVETTECRRCGNKFKERPSSARKFCSRECQMERRQEEGLPARARQVELTCKGCGKSFSTARSNAEAGKKYCSKKCYDNDRNGETLSCEVCGDDFYAYDTYADKARFCSQGCYGEWLSENRSGEDSWNWKGEDRFSDRPAYGPGWTEAKREQVRERDGRECTDCGIGTLTHRDQYDQKLHVHHEVDPRKSTNPTVHNATRNLQTLCVRCHRSQHSP